MKVIVIGINGLAGSAFGRVLPEMGHHVIGVTRENYDTHSGSHADILINANGNSSKPKAESDPEGEIDRTVNTAARFCDDFTFKKYVQISSGDVYNDLTDPSNNSESSEIIIDDLSVYGRCKLQAEDIIKEKCGNWLIIRSGGLIGPGLRKGPVYDLLTGDRLFIHPDSSLGFLHTDTLARAVMTVAEKEISNEVFNAAGSGKIAVRRIMELTENTEAVHEQNAPAVNYELSNRKISKHYPMPSSEDAVQNFIDWWKSNG